MIRSRATGRRLAGKYFAPLANFLIVVFIGVGATLAWQSYGDAAREMVIARASNAGLVVIGFDD